MSQIPPPTLKANSPKRHLFETFDIDTAIEWLTQYGKNVVYALVGLIVLLILIYKLSSHHATQAEHDYLQASADFSTLLQQSNEGETITAQTSFQQLSKLIQAHPELHAAYDATLAQMLLNTGNVDAAKPLITNTLKRTRDDGLASYHRFSSNTLLIAEGKHQEALHASQTLQQQMLNELNTTPPSERSFSDILFAFNLLRIAMLQQQLGLAQEELQTWRQWKEYAKLTSYPNTTNHINPIAFHTIMQHLATGSITLPDYISHREKLLTVINH